MDTVYIYIYIFTGEEGRKQEGKLGWHTSRPEKKGRVYIYIYRV